MKCSNAVTVVRDMKLARGMGMDCASNHLMLGSIRVQLIKHGHASLVLFGRKCERNTLAVRYEQ